MGVPEGTGSLVGQLAALYKAAMSLVFFISSRFAAAAICCLLVSGCGAPAASDPAADAAAAGEVEAQSIFGATSACPTAPENLPINLFFWRTGRQLDGFKWSSDGRRAAATSTPRAGCSTST